MNLSVATRKKGRQGDPDPAAEAAARPGRPHGAPAGLPAYLRPPLPLVQRQAEEEEEEELLQTAPAPGAVQRQGEEAEPEDEEAEILQTKAAGGLALGRPDDPYERDADRVARAVLQGAGEAVRPRPL
ncbi:MAG: hypothetical protein Kow0092_38650 [Deferrisomatales bacterium]